MFQDIIKRLTKINAPVADKYKIPIAGIKAFDKILNSQNDASKEAIIISAIEEFSKYAHGDEESVKEFENILWKEFNDVPIQDMKQKAKLLQQLWKTEAKIIVKHKKKTRIIGIRLTEEEYQELLEKAKKQGVNLSKYIRWKLGLET